MNIYVYVYNPYLTACNLLFQVSDVATPRALWSMPMQLAWYNVSNLFITTVKFSWLCDRNNQRRERDRINILLCFIISLYTFFLICHSNSIVHTVNIMLRLCCFIPISFYNISNIMFDRHEAKRRSFLELSDEEIFLELGGFFDVL